MKLKIDQDRLLYDVANLAFVIADVNSSAEDREAIHQLMDITQEGNIDRVANVSLLALTIAAEVCEPILKRRISGNHSRLIKESVHEYVVCRVIADWLTVTLPKLAPVWEEKARIQLHALQELVAEILSDTSAAGFRRQLFPTP